MVYTTLMLQILAGLLLIPLTLHLLQVRRQSKLDALRVPIWKITCPVYQKEELGMNRMERRALKRRVGARRYEKLAKIRMARESQEVQG